MKRELFSRRIRVINAETEALHNEVNTLYENLVDSEYKESLESIERIRVMLVLLKNQVMEGNILKI